LSAAADILDGSGVPKAVVLLCDILPSLLVKLIAPYFMHIFPYGWRIIFCVVLSVLALQLNAWWYDDISIQLGGVILASASSGFGEINFLALCTFYPNSVVTGWSSGTGAAGVIGSLLYLALTTWARLDYKPTMLILSPMPIGMALAYFLLMSKPHLEVEKTRSVTSANRPSVILGDSTRLLSSDNHEEEEDDDGASINYINSDMVDEIETHNGTPRISVHELKPIVPARLTFIDRLKLIRPLIIPFMLPLFLVYWAEYTINQGISPVLLFDHESGETPLPELRDHYVYYQFLYQTGVFISRSSRAIFSIPRIWIPSILQVLTLILLLTEALYGYFPTVFIVFLIIFWEGLLGGSAYVNCYFQVNTEIKPEYREFSMAAVGLADGLGISLAGVTALFLEPALCNFQVDQGRTLCEQV